MTAEEHAAALWALERASHDEFVAKIRAWAEAAEASGDELRARRHREHLPAWPRCRSRGSGRRGPRDCTGPLRATLSQDLDIG
ncbi:hypothetical protein ACFQZ4_53070 [Catellatospora coxensis]